MRSWIYLTNGEYTLLKHKWKYLRLCVSSMSNNQEHCLHALLMYQTIYIFMFSAVTCSYRVKSGGKPHIFTARRHASAVYALVMCVCVCVCVSVTSRCLVLYFNTEPRLKWNKIVLAAKIILFHFRRHVWNKVKLYIGWQWRNFFISYLCQLFFRHVVGGAL